MIGSAVTIVAAQVFAGKESEFLVLADEMHALIKNKGYGFVQAMQDLKNPRCYYYICTWSSPEAAERFDKDPDMQALSAKLNQTGKLTPLVGLARTIKQVTASLQAAR